MDATIPYGWYSDPEILRREQERIFRSAWQYAGHTGQLPQPGSFFTARAGRVPIVVTRDRDGVVRAFINVCRHRGFPVVEGEGRRSTLQCPYHAWTYGLDGCLRTAPRAEEEPEFPKDELGLIPVAVATWGPFVFVNADADAEPLTDALGSMPAQVAGLGLDVENLVHHHRWQTEVEANWKIVCENFLECYHCQVAHPGFAEVIDVSAESYALDASGRLSSQYGPIRESGRGKIDLGGELARSQFHFLWPNLTVNIFPGRPNISIGPVTPLTPHRTHRFLDYFFGPDVDEEWIEDLTAFDDQVGREDRVLVESVHRGIASGALERGVLMSRSEQLIGHFQALTGAALAD
jgi:phenylpropionate dioxygenase-like ring-hydroxylating dioxygenase large terminal subunit